ncbi:DUF4783 domain-containing protein [Cytophagaceae bacterium ABcell3]|nr:DUF4783 domain-containing protein [Cytophagaceae bacterium ABcell3]
MKLLLSKISIIFVFFLLVKSGNNAFAQNDTYKVSKVAIKSGSSKELAKYFYDIVEVSFDGEKASYSKAHAEIMFKDFFKKHPALSFEDVHHGSTKGGLTYAIGKYTHAKGAFRVVIYIKKIKGMEVIDTIEFSKW